MKKITVGLLLLFTSTIGLAQETTKKQKKVRPGKQIKISSTQQINQLQNGALLVRLKTQKSTIAA
jgi:hypothetical protein